MVLECECCTVTVPSEEAMAIHKKGKRHQRLVALMEDRERRANFTVFVRGFRQDTSEDELKSHFSKFGEVSEIYMDYRRNGLFALVEFKEESSAKAAIGEKSQEINGTPITVKPRQFQKPPQRKAFKAKMKKSKEKMTKPEKIRRKTIKSDHEVLLQKFADVSTVGEQMRTLCEFVQMTEDEVQQKNEICDMLQASLVKFFPKCTIHQFGSSVNGFGVKGCDADIYLDFHDEDEEEPMNTADLPAVKLPYHRDIPTVKKSEGPLSSADLQNMTSTDKVKLVARVLVEHSIGCNNIISIPSARCPLIKFLHEPTGIRCDLSINNKLALRNTRLLKMCSHIDARVSPLVFTVRYWAKMKEVAGNLNSGPRLTNYALTFLVMQYLQTCQPPVLPTITKMADIAGEERVMIDGWDCSYLEAAESFAITSNTQTVEDLLKGFFEYYASMDFSTIVLQMSTGQAQPIQEMVETNLGVDDPKQAFRIGPVCIQDPYVINHNIAGNVTDKMKQKISEEFQIAALKCRQWGMASEPRVEVKMEVDAVKTEDEDPESLKGTVVTRPVHGLAVLLDAIIPDELSKKFIRLRSMDDEIEEGTTFTVLLKVANLPIEAFRNTQTPDFRLNWCYKVCVFMQRVLEIILLFETQVLAQTIADGSQTELKTENAENEQKPLEESPRKRRSDEATKAASKKSREEPFVTPVGCAGDALYSQKLPGEHTHSPSLHMELLCSACCRTWNGRKTLRKEVQAGELEGLELEREISEQIVENMGFSEKYLVQFHMNIDTVVETSKTAVMLRLQPTREGKEFSCFFPFFKTFIRRLVENNLYEPW